MNNMDKLYEVVLNDSFGDGDGNPINKEEVVFRSYDKTAAEAFVNKYNYTNGQRKRFLHYYWFEIRTAELDQPSTGFKTFVNQINKGEITIKPFEQASVYAANIPVGVDFLKNHKHYYGYIDYKLVELIDAGYDKNVKITAKDNIPFWKVYAKLKFWVLVKRVKDGSDWKITDDNLDWDYFDESYFNLVTEKYDTMWYSTIEEAIEHKPPISDYPFVDFNF